MTAGYERRRWMSAEHNLSASQHARVIGGGMVKKDLGGHWLEVSQEMTHRGKSAQVAQCLVGHITSSKEVEQIAQEVIADLVGRLRPRHPPLGRGRSTLHPDSERSLGHDPPGRLQPRRPQPRLGRQRLEREALGPGPDGAEMDLEGRREDRGGGVLARRRTLAWVHEDGVVQRWDPDRELLLPPLHIGYEELRCLAFSPDGCTLAAAGKSGKIHL